MMEILTILGSQDANELYGKILASVQDKQADPTTEIKEYRWILEEMYKRILQPLGRTFSTIHNRMIFIDKTYPVQQSLANELHGLRILCNAVIHDGLKVGPSEYLSGTKLLAEAIHFFSGAPIPAGISSSYDGKMIQKLANTTQPVYETIEFDRCTVFKVEKMDEFNHYLLHCDSENQLGEYVIQLKDNSLKGQHEFQKDFRVLGPAIASFSTLHVFNLSKDTRREQYFHTYHKTTIVLEPDFLVDVTTLARCYLSDLSSQENSTERNLTHNPKWGLLQKFLPVPTSEAIFTGTLANAMMDAYLTESGIDWDRKLDQMVEENIWDAVRLGPKAIENVKKSLRSNHLPNLKALEKQPHQRNIIEPTFYSAEYGLLGRLDILRETDNAPLKKDIYELKSGRSPKYGVFQEHQMQAIGYHLLLRSVFGKSIYTTAAIIYSQAEKHTLRDVPTTQPLEQNLLMVRNLFIIEALKIAQGDFELFRKVGKKEFGGWPKYAADALAELRSDFDAASGTERRFVAALMSFLMRELIQQKTGWHHHGEGSSMGFASLWLLDIDQKRKTFAIVSDMVYTGKNKGNINEVVFSRTAHLQTHVAFRKGDIVLLYPQMETDKGALRHQVLKATIVDIGKEAVTVKLFNPQVDFKLFAQHPKWCMERDMMESNTYHLMQSTIAFLKAGKRQRQLYLGQLAPQFDSRQVLDLTQEATKINSPSQANAIQSALAAKDFMLIQGPPGTGKTSRVLAEIVLDIFKNTDQVTFLLAFTNRAVDKLLECIKELEKKHPQYKIPLLRLSSDTHDPDTLACKAKALDLGKANQLVQDTRVFVGTLAGFLRMQGSLPATLRRDTLIIDEASQVLEPQVAGIIPSFKRFILIGDHKQLPPIVTQPEQGCIVKEQELLQAGFKDLRTSVFERLWCQAEAQVKKGGPDAAAWRDSMVTLTAHFRMHEQIVDLIAHHYNGKLQLGKPKEQQALLPLYLGKNALEKKIAGARVLFIESPAGNGRTNEMEARRVVQLIQAVRSLNPQAAREEGHIGIITPWKAQINCIAQTMENARISGITVDTVERFQGSECKNILLSLATASQSLLSVLTSSIYFDGETQIEIDRKLNVSISRAEQRIIVLGETAILNANRHYKRLVSDIQAMGGYIPHHEAQKLFTDIQY